MKVRDLREQLAKADDDDLVMLKEWISDDDAAEPGALPGVVHLYAASHAESVIASRVATTGEWGDVRVFLVEG